MDALSTTLADPRKSFDAFAAAFARRLRPGDVVALSGPLGAGKTAFVRAVVRALHGADQSCSPTFTFRHRYDGDPPIDHIDFFRIDDPRESAELGLEEAFDGRSIVLVEWWRNAPDAHSAAPIRNRNRRRRRTSRARCLFASRHERSCYRRQRWARFRPRSRATSAIVASRSEAGSVALERGLAIVEAVLPTRRAWRTGDRPAWRSASGPAASPGLRIAIAYAKSLAAVWQRPLVPIDSFDLLEFGRRLRPRADGRRGAPRRDLRALSRTARESRAPPAESPTCSASCCRRALGGELDVVGAPKDVLHALAERGIIVRSVDPP